LTLGWPYGSFSRFVNGRKYVISSAILGRYARSLADVAFKENIEDQVIADLQTFREVFGTVPDILEVFHSPAVPRESKEKLLFELIARYPVNPISSNFLNILLQHNRIRYFSQILDGFLKTVNERKGVVFAKVTAAAPLSPQNLKMLEARLSEITGKLVNVESQTDKGLLGGIVVQIGSTVFDGSIRTQLAEVKRRLTET
jgi:F-type H+-transporting ATPase subunit delta